MLIVSVFLCLLPAAFAGYLESIAASAATGPQERFQGMVAFSCGRPSLHLTPSGGWQRDLSQDCVTSAAEIRVYCQRVYPGREVVNVEPAPYRVRIGNWCGFDQKHCTAEQASEVTVHPYRCLAAGFQSDALLVPSNCTFHHLVPGINEGPDAKQECKAHHDWQDVAKQECQRRSAAKRQMRSFSGLLECKQDEKHKYGFFRGVEFVCCPPKQAVSPPATGLVMEAASTPKRDLYVDYLNRALDKTESEHERYVHAKEQRKRKMTEDEDRLVRAFIEAERDIEAKWNIDPDNSKREEESVIQRFKAAFSALLNEEMDELRQLDHIHQERVFAKLHAKSMRCKKMLEYASQEVDPKLDRISIAAFAYLRAVMKEKVHAINHHTHLMDTDPDQAKEQLPRLKTYLKRLREDITKIVADLTKSVPKLEKEVRTRILKFMRTYSEVEASAVALEETGRLSAKPIKGQSRKDVEMDHMQNVIKAYRHRKPVPAAARKEKLVHVVPVEETDKEVVLEKKVESVAHSHSHAGHGMKHHAKAMDDARGHQEQAHSTSLVSNSASTWAIVASVAAVALVAALTAVLVLRRRYAGYSRSPHADPATVAVEKSLAPSAVDDGAAGGAEDLHAMQTNGYENPTYKYFELQGQEGDAPKA